MKPVPVGYSNSDTQATEQVDPSLVIADDAAYPTGRVLDGSGDHGAAEEWAEPATMPDGRNCKRIYLFSADEITDDAESYPWDDEHVARIRLID